MFYEGHLPAFSVIAFLRRGLGRPPVDARLEALFERGIDPETEASAVPRSGASTVWPSRDEVARSRARATRPSSPRCRVVPRSALRSKGLYTALEHEAMHQETLLYMWHRLPYEQKRVRTDVAIGGSDGSVSGQRRRPLPTMPASVVIPAGIAMLGADRGARRLRLGQRVRCARRPRSAHSTSTPCRSPTRSSSSS